MTLVTEIVGEESYQYYPLGSHVVRALGVCGSRPTFKYTHDRDHGDVGSFSFGGES